MISVDDHLELPAKKAREKEFYHHVYALPNEPTPIENHSFGDNIIHGTHNLCEGKMNELNVHYYKVGQYLPSDTSSLPYV